MSIAEISSEPAVSEAAPGSAEARLAEAALEEQADVRSKTRRGAAWSVLGYGGSQVLRFGGNLILTRLLTSEAFGLLALVQVFLSGLQLFSDIGIGPSIIQNRRGKEQRFVNTAFTIQAGRGIFLWLIACVAAIPFARFYGDPRLEWLLPVVGFSAVINGFNSTKLFSQSRELALERLTLIELSSHAVGLCVMVTWALIEPSVVALVGGALVSNLVRLILSHWALPGERNRFCFDRQIASELIRFGRWIFLSTVLTFAASQSDRLIFGKLIPLDLLGVYSIALLIAMVPSQGLSHFSSSLMFPLYSRVVNSGGPLDPEFQRSRFPILLFAGLTSAGLVAGGGLAVELLYDDRYLQAGWIVQVLAISVWFLALEVTNGAALLALGHAQWVALGCAAKFVGMCGLIPLGFHWAGFPGAVVGYAGSEVLRYLASVLSVGHYGLRGWVQDLRLTGLVAISSLVGWGGVLWLQDRGAPLLLSAVYAVSSVGLFWLPLGYGYLKALWKRLRLRARWEPA